MLQTLHNSKYAFFRVSVIAIVLGFFAFLGLQACLATTKHTLLLILYFLSSLEISFSPETENLFYFQTNKIHCQIFIWGENCWNKMQHGW